MAVIPPPEKVPTVYYSPNSFNPSPRLQLTGLDPLLSPATASGPTQCGYHKRDKQLAVTVVVVVVAVGIKTEAAAASGYCGRGSGGSGSRVYALVGVATLAAGLL
jgi:hypothetical protein